MKCSHCPIKDGPCIAESPSWSFACGMASKGDPVELRWVVDRSAMAADRPVETPTLYQMAKNFAGAVVDHVASGFEKASPEVQEERRALCRACPFLKDEKCGKCGCIAMDLKRSWASSECPDGRWPAVEGDPTGERPADVEQGVH